MQLSKRKVISKTPNQFFNFLYQLVADIRNPREAESLLKDLLKPVELKMVARRLAVVYWLDQNRSYNEIKKGLSVSTATVATLAKQLKEKKGFAIALEKIKAEEWAGRWAQKISHKFKIRP